MNVHCSHKLFHLLSISKKITDLEAEIVSLKENVEEAKNSEKKSLGRLNINFSFFVKVDHSKHCFNYSHAAVINFV